jgi:maltose alpha-D-glucosyltransferase/alpha-amylase
LQSEPERALRNRIASGRPLEARVPSLEQSNTTLFYGDELVLKLFRQIDAGENPDAELTRFLTARNFPHVAPVLGVIDYDGPQLAGATLGLVQRYVPSHGNAWDLTLEALGRALEHALSLHHAGQRPTLPSGDWLAAGRETPSESVSSVIGSYVEVARALGRRVAELHTVLASEREDEAFAPEPFAGHYHRSVLEAVRDRIERALELLRRSKARLPESARESAERAHAASEALGRKLAQLARVKVDALRIRCHGDLHLGQILNDGRDFVFLDFEGEPAVSLNVRKLKRAALVDVSGMLRSFHYASVRALRGSQVRPEDVAVLAPWAEAWYRWVGGAFVDAYRGAAARGSYLPSTDEGFSALLALHLIDKCAYEVSYELNNRPEWVDVPLAGLLALAE